MTLCTHHRCGRESYLWSLEQESKYAETVKQPYCIHCGLFENISEYKAKKIGFWVNITARLADEYALSQVQRRLIVQQLTNTDEFTDTYGLSFKSQLQFYIQTVQHVTQWSREKIQRCIQ